MQTAGRGLQRNGGAEVKDSPPHLSCIFPTPGRYGDGQPRSQTQDPGLRTVLFTVFYSSCNPKNTWPAKPTLFNS